MDSTSSAEIHPDSPADFSPSSRFASNLIVAFNLSSFSNLIIAQTPRLITHLSPNNTSYTSCHSHTDMGHCDRSFSFSAPQNRLPYHSVLPTTPPPANLNLPRQTFDSSHSACDHYSPKAAHHCQASL